MLIDLDLDVVILQEVVHGLGVSQACGTVRPTEHGIARVPAELDEDVENLIESVDLFGGSCCCDQNLECLLNGALGLVLGQCEFEQLSCLVDCTTACKSTLRSRLCAFLLATSFVVGRLNR